ncbi:MAG: hypothetical protein AB7O56_11310 [Bauldia sp.]
MSGHLRELTLSCRACGSTELLTVDDLPSTTPITCNACGEPIGRWDKLRTLAIPSTIPQPDHRLVH